MNQPYIVTLDRQIIHEPRNVYGCGTLFIRVLYSVTFGICALSNILYELPQERYLAMCSCSGHTFNIIVVGGLLVLRYPCTCIGGNTHMRSTCMYVIIVLLVPVSYVQHCS